MIVICSSIPDTVPSQATRLLTLLWQDVDFSTP